MAKKTQPNELYKLAVSFMPFTEVDRVKRTQDTIEALTKLHKFRDIVDAQIAQLSSDNVLSKEEFTNFEDLPESYQAVRLHSVEYHWQIRHSRAINIISRNYPIKRGPRNVEGAKAFLEVFSKQRTEMRRGYKYWTPSAQWYAYFKSVYHASDDNKDHS